MGWENGADIHERLNVVPAIEVTFTAHPVDTAQKIIRLNGRQAGYLLPNGHISMIRRVEADVVPFIEAAVRERTGTFKGICMPPAVPKELLNGS